METLNRHFHPAFSKALLTLFSVFLSVLVFAQDATKTVDVNINSGSGGGFFSNTWVWVVGGAVFILLLVALLRGGGRKSA
ncbi:MAG: hypothetical protein M3040_14575 [Bacteroidota bacterium]|nr:hypothetical protein [Bacteroidota bacterium]